MTEVLCFKSVRSTQYERLHDEGSVYGTNTVLSTLMWNMIAAATTFFLWWNKSGKNMITGLCIADWVIWLPILHWPLFAVAAEGSVPEIGLIFGFTVVFYLLVLWQMFVSWEFSDNIVFWVQYSINLALVFVVSNMLMQRRDDMMNMVFAVLGAVIGLFSLSSDYARVVLDLFSKSNGSERDKNLPEVMFVFDAFTTINTYTWFANAAIIILIFNISAPFFPSTPFSNARDVIWVILPILLLIPLMQGRYITGKVMGGGTDEGKFMVMRSWLDFAARAVFTIAIIIDLGATKHNDSVPIGNV